MKTLILLVALVGLASCAKNSHGCVGWRKLTMAEASVDYLAAHDPTALKAAIVHNELGQHMNCWK